MSIKSTTIVTRRFAIDAILDRIDDMHNLNDVELADLLADVIHNGYYNFRIVSESELEENKKDIYSNRYIDNINDLPSRNDAW